MNIINFILVFYVVFLWLASVYVCVRTQWNNETEISLLWFAIFLSLFFFVIPFFFLFLALKNLRL